MDPQRRRHPRPRGHRAVALAVAWLAVALLALSAVGCSAGSTVTTPAPTTSTSPSSSTTAPATTPTTVPPTAGSEPGAVATEADLAATDIVTGLDVPWEFRFLPGGRELLVTERTGRLVRVSVADGTITEVARLPVAAQGEGGLLGLDLDPSYPDKPNIYVSYTHALPSGGVANRISRLTFDGDRATDEKILVEGIPGGGIHNGGRLAFGPDGALWATTGDAGRSQLAQDPAGLAGKVLRMTAEGQPAPGNPFPGSLVYTYGHRNPQGIAWLPGTLTAFITEHGPSDNDEINRLVAGRNYGWPRVRGIAGQPGYEDPLITWTPTIAPAGATFGQATTIPGWQDSFLFVTLKDSSLRRLVPADAAFSGVASQETLFKDRFGRLRAIHVGPDGALYLATSNRDGRGDPRSGDDRIIRVAPAR